MICFHLGRAFLCRRLFRQDFHAFSFMSKILIQFKFKTISIKIVQESHNSKGNGISCRKSLLFYSPLPWINLTQKFLTQIKLKKKCFQILANRSKVFQIPESSHDLRKKIFLKNFLSPEGVDELLKKLKKFYVLRGGGEGHLKNRMNKHAYKIS